MPELDLVFLAQAQGQRRNRTTQLKNGDVLEAFK
jgi:hypothetical protein